VDVGADEPARLAAAVRQAASLATTNEAVDR